MNYISYYINIYVGRNIQWDATSQDETSTVQNRNGMKHPAPIKWCQAGKCQVLQITRLKQSLQSQYTLHGQVLESIDSAKYLGVTISQDLNWNNHINNIIGKANRTLGFVKRNVKTWNEPVKELAYKTLVRPQAEYASSIWNPYTKQNITKIEMIQRRAARWVKNNYSPYDSVSNMLDSLGWRSLENRCIDSRLVMFYRIIHGYVEIQIPTYFEKPQR